MRRSRAPKKVVVNGLLMAVVEKEADELRRESDAYEKLSHLPSYSMCNVTEASVASPWGDEVKFNSFEVVRTVLNALRAVHNTGVVHNDIKNEHVLRRRLHDHGQVGGAFFIYFVDFGFSGQLGHKILGHTKLFSSFDALASKWGHPIDDYESILMCALVQVSDFYNKCLLPPEDSDAPTDWWLRWKLDLMQRVLEVTSQQSVSKVAALLGPRAEPVDVHLTCQLFHTLRRVWAMPRFPTFWIMDREHLELLKGPVESGPFMELHAFEVVVLKRPARVSSHDALLGEDTKNEGDDNDEEVLVARDNELHGCMRVFSLSPSGEPKQVDVSKFVRPLIVLTGWICRVELETDLAPMDFLTCKLALARHLHNSGLSALVLRCQDLLRPLSADV